MVENAAFNGVGSSNGSGGANVQNGVAAAAADHNQSAKTNQRSTEPRDQNFQMMQQQEGVDGNGVLGGHRNPPPPQRMNGVDLRRNGEIDEDGDGGEEGFKREKEMRDLEDMLSKLNPMAEEFVPPSLSSAGNHIPVLLPPGGGHFGYDASNFVALQPHSGLPNGNFIRRVTI